MSGHSKWAGIKHKKALVDARRASIFTRVANNITIAARSGGDADFNPALRTAIDAARKVNMPKDNVERAIKRGTGELGGVAPEELLYEGFGPENVAVLVAALTDNRNRTAPEIRTIFTKNGGRFAEGGGVAYQFSKRGIIRLTVSLDMLVDFEEAVLESGADDYTIQDDSAIVYTDLGGVHRVRESLSASGFESESASVEYVAQNPIEIENEASLEKVAGFIELLEDHPDVTAVYTNLSE